MHQSTGTDQWTEGQAVTRTVLWQDVTQLTETGGGGEVGVSTCEQIPKVVFISQG